MVNKSQFNHENTLLFNCNFPFNCFYINGYTTRAHWHKHTEVLLIKSGSCEVLINGVLYSCSEGDIILVPRTYLHSIIPGIDSSYYALVIGDGFFSNLLNDMHINELMCPYLLGTTLIPLHISISQSEYEAAAALIRSIILQFDMKKNHFECIIQAKLIEFFCCINDLFLSYINPVSRYQNHNSQILKNALQYIEEHLSEKITVLSMSKFTNLSAAHFCRLFKAYTGKTLIEYINCYRLENGKKLLIETTQSVTQISDQLGFCNINYFSKSFKDKYGCSPLKMRKQNHSL